jgi:glycerophosphoryl diester phosphodiesterase
MMNVTTLVGHRGCPLEFPENSLQGIARALALGTGDLEIDIQLSADHRVILHHDRTLDRVCGATGPVHERTLEQLQRLSFSEPDFFGNRFAPTSVTTLSDVLALTRQHPGVTLFIEIKSIAVEKFGAEIVLKAIADVTGPPGADEVLIARRPDALRTGRACGWNRTGLVLENWNQRKSQQAREADYLFCNATRLPAQGELGLRGQQLAVYDLIEPAPALQLLERGVDLVETFDLAGMQGAMQATARGRS